MEYSNEIKAKVFAQYLGHKVTIKSYDTQDYCEWNIDRMAYAKEWNKWSEVKLILKPLSSISDEDAIELIKISCKGTDIYPENIRVEKGEIKYDCDFFGESFSEGQYETSIQPIQSFQYLQSKGYDLPQYLLGGKTLHEAGLCIYEHEIKL